LRIVLPAEIAGSIETPEYLASLIDVRLSIRLDALTLHYGFENAPFRANRGRKVSVTGEARILII
jgi:hypothetical protein